MAGTQKSLSDHVALVTGAGRGIGAQIACFLANEGAAVALLDRDQAALDKTRQEIESKGRDYRVIGIRADVSREEDLRRAFEETKNKFGDVSILVNNAAIAEVAEFGQLTSDQLQSYWGTNVVPMVLGSQLAKPHFERRAQSGRQTGQGPTAHCWIFNLSSWSGKPSAQLEQHGGKTLAYDMCAAAIDALTRGSAQYFHEIHERQKQQGDKNPIRVRVVGLAPYVFDTELGKELARGVGAPSPQELAKQQGKRAGDPSVVGRVLSEAVAGRSKFEFKSGNVFTVDGEGAVKNIAEDQPFATLPHPFRAAAA